MVKGKLQSKIWVKSEEKELPRVLGTQKFLFQAELQKEPNPGTLTRTPSTIGQYPRK
jgi:hypothetical protein